MESYIQVIGGGGGGLFRLHNVTIVDYLYYLIQVKITYDSNVA
jgi:hypothetical protein